jgi:transcription elongation factor GreA
LLSCTFEENYVPTTNSASAAWLTQEAFDRLQAELTHLSGPGRAEIVSKIEQARSEGDLKENGGYHAAKDEQGKIEARIRQLTELLRYAHVGETPADDGIVEQGMVVVATVAGDKTTFLLGSREVGAEDMDVFSERSPLGAAIMGSKIGDKLSYVAPNGKTIEVEIISATPYQG